MKIIQRIERIFNTGLCLLLAAYAIAATLVLAMRALGVV
jgi:hypothetical protein